ncbi:hypothetical protein CYMTET_2639 [Cymbomonas tetramitiformis]|uniref:Uncharacterized protein n=1 Tax=Cymbomonas tetramitiformis TaxID=36881 RepID=A0AAE0LM54_9CHLO|nr:hypothetical protein CYMTET_2639 [Cymbomonas tetramitiformis]
MPIFGYDDKQMFGRRDVVLQILDECGLTLSRPYNFSKQGSFIAEEYFAMLLTSLGVTVIETDIITDRCDAKAHIQDIIKLAINKASEDEDEDDDEEEDDEHEDEDEDADEEDENDEDERNEAT